MNDNKVSFTPIQDIGFRNLIERISSMFEKHGQGLIFGIGDDAAVLDKETDKLVFKSQSYQEGVHFDLVYTPLQHLGYKVASLAVSDVVAMNARPKFITINLGLTNKISVEMTELFYKGVKAACDEFSLQLTGGDFVPAGSAISVSVSCIGTSEQPVYRSGAKEGDAICVTGDLGAATCGLMILLREKKHWESLGGETMKPDFEEFSYVVEKQLVPKARLDLINSFSQNLVTPHAMIDITKGLNHNLLDLCNASGVGARIYEAAIPVLPETRAAADELEEDIDKFILFGGEDAQLLFTLPEKEVERFAKAFKDFVVIGKVVNKDEGVKMQTAEGSIMTLHY